MSITSLITHILTYGIFLYSLVLLLFYLGIALLSIGETRNYMRKNSFTDYRLLASSPHAPSVSIIAPAYNEGATIIENVRSLLSLYYSNLEILIINDGSKDDSLQRLIEAYQLEKIDYHVQYRIPTKEVRGIYKSRNPVYKKLVVVDKVNGGKADALNVGINISANNYIVCIDVDCILEQDAVLKMIKPFLEETDKKVIASGGVIRIANSCEIKDGRLVKVRLPKNYWARMQSLEYIRAFILGRMAWARLNGLLLISGAFGAFDKRIAIKAGGYNHNTVGEDMELVVRMRRYMEEKKQPYRITYIPDPLCWTEAPTTTKILGRQRNRWIRGTIETLRFHKKMFFNPKYGLLGTISYPYWFFFEMLAPLIEFFGFIVFLLLAMMGLIYWPVFFSLLVFIIAFGYLYSAFAAYMEVTTYNMYRRRTDMMKLLLTALTEPFIFHPFVVWAAIKGYIDIIRKKNSWGEMTRQGFGGATAAKKSKANMPLRNNIQLSASSFVSRFTIAVILFILIRSYEAISNGVLHGFGKVFTSTYLYGLANDLLFLVWLSAPLYVLYAIVFLLHKKSANILFTIIITLACIVQIALVQYYITTLVMLGGDLWSYSWEDIKQTVGASGTFVKSLSILALFAAVVIATFVVFVRYIRINSKLSLALLIIIVTAGFINPVKLLSAINIKGNEYEKNLVLNKSYFFYRASLNRILPSARDEDLYADNKENSTDTKYKYVDESQYPFLHFDETPDVLSPFFTPDSTATKPNIVILMVEGLGRAFTNKGAYLGNFTPFLDSLSAHSLYWENFLSEGGRTFAVLPSLLGSLPFAKNGFNELGDKMPNHLSLLSLLKHNGYHISFYYGGDASFDKMDLFLQKNKTDDIYDLKTFPGGYTKLPVNTQGFSWGYGDKELYRRYFETVPSDTQPSLSVLLTVATHSPFLLNDQSYYNDLFEKRMEELRFDEDEKITARRYQFQFASILYCDDALRQFFTTYARRPEFKNTIFLITGDHRMPEIPMSTKIDRYHVPLIIYSPLLQRSSTFKSISTHYDITPTLLAFLKNRCNMDVPNRVSWIGNGIDTAHSFRNIHAYPLMQTKNDINDFIKGNYMINGSSLFEIKDNMDMEPLTDDKIYKSLNVNFNRFKQRNNGIIAGKKLVPDSLYQHYYPK